MGGRGAFVPGIGIPEEKREYSTIAYIDGVPVVQWDYGTNNRTIVMSNTSSEYYAFSKEHGKIEKIYFFRGNHELYKEIDLKEIGKEHFHLFSTNDNGEIGRQRHSPSNAFKLTEEEWKWVKKAQEFNKKYKMK